MEADEETSDAVSDAPSEVVDDVLHEHGDDPIPLCSDALATSNNCSKKLPLDFPNN